MIVTPIYNVLVDFIPEIKEDCITGEGLEKNIATLDEKIQETRSLA